MGKCEEYMEQISAYIDGELSTDEQESLLKHTEACAHCRSLLEAYRQISADIESDLAEVPGDLTGKIMAAVRADKVKRFKNPSYVFGAYTAAAAVIVLAIFAYSNGFLNFNSGSKSAQDAAAGITVASNSVEAQSELFAAFSLPEADDSETDGLPKTDGLPETAPAAAPAEAGTVEERTVGRIAVDEEAFDAGNGEESISDSIESIDQFSAFVITEEAPSALMNGESAPDEQGEASAAVPAATAVPVDGNAPAAEDELIICTGLPLSDLETAIVIELTSDIPENIDYLTPVLDTETEKRYLIPADQMDAFLQALELAGIQAEIRQNDESDYSDHAMVIVVIGE